MQINVLKYFENGALLKCIGKVAVQDHSGKYTFGQLERFGKNCAALISSQTANKLGPIPVFLPKSCQSIAADLGILYSGNAYANLDVKSPSERLRNILDHLHPDVIVTCAEHAPALRAIGVAEEKLLFIEPAMVDEVLFDNAALLRRWDTLVDTDPFCLIHTSGSTGQPKGVVLNHRSTIDFVDWALERFDLQGGEVMGSLAPIYFDAYTLEFCMMLARGATMIVVPENLAMFPLKLVEFIAAHPINFIFWVPTIMLNIANLDLLAQRGLGQLATVFFIGEVFPTKQLNYWRHHLPQAKFVNLYGPIEITVACTYYVVDRELAEDEKLPVGFPCRNTEILVLNERNQLAAVNERGEICVRGSSLALGYFDNPEHTAKAFVQNPLNPHYPELIYRTGDVGYWNSHGELMFLGRRDFQIKHLGFRIELGEIEHAALRVAGIRNCCVVYNQNAKEITLFYESDHELTPAFIRERLSASLPKYMLPVAFHWLEQMPRNPNGKIDRAQLVAGI
jgi:D-alanine--poly(phosphoribitol) ligase subunit 1